MNLSIARAGEYTNTLIRPIARGQAPNDWLLARRTVVFPPENVRDIHPDPPEGFAVAGEKALPVILSGSTGRLCPFLTFWLNR